MVAFRRLSAYAVDWCVFACWAGLVFAISWFARDGEPTWPESPWLGQALGSSLTTVPFALYFTFMEGSPWQATLGKRLFGLQVVRHDGRCPSRGRTLARTAVKLLPWEFGHTALYQALALDRAGREFTPWLMVVGAIAVAAAAWYVVSLFSATGRTPYDRVSGTRVERPARAVIEGPRH